MSGTAQDGTDSGRARRLAGWAVLVVLLAYAVAIHHGVGPQPDGEPEPWSPRSFLLHPSWIQPLEERPALGVAALALPAAALAAGVFMLGGSAVARTLALAAVLSTALFAFYGLRPPGPQIWSFFGWRGSAVMATVGLAVAAVALSPLLARSWLRLSPTARAATYVPIFLAVVAIMRNVTGTDPSLRFAISPWPVVPMFGISIGAVAVLGVIAAMACAALAFGARGALPGRLRYGAPVAAAAIPPVWFKLWHESFPPDAMAALAAVGLVCALAALWPAHPERLVTRGRHLAWGFLLAALPLTVGEAWSHWDYVRTREGSARRVIEALDAYYGEHEEYPEELDALVEAGHLDRVPEPHIGFGLLEDQRFQYQNFGTSYSLEFSAADWVQCAYNPPWSEEGWDEAGDDPVHDGDSDTAAAGDEEAALEEAWSCPQQPPELW